MHEIFVGSYREKDTVSKQNQDNKVSRKVHSLSFYSTVGFNSFVHHLIPVLSCQNLKFKKTQKDNGLRVLADEEVVSDKEVRIGEYKKYGRLPLTLLISIKHPLDFTPGSYLVCLMQCIG